MVELLTPLALIFVVSAGILVFAKRFNVPPVPVYIIVGLLIAPFIDRGETLVLAQFGIAFLVFVFGVYVEPERISAVARDSEHVAALQLLVVGVAAAGGALLLGFQPLNALYVGIAASLSSSLVGRELLEQDIHLDLVHGRLTQSIHFVQDLFAVVFVLLLSATTFEFDAIALQLGYGVILLIAALIIRVYLFDLLVRLSRGSDELIALTGVAILVVFIAGAEFLDVSIVVGAFAAGISIKLGFEDNLPLLNALDSLENFFAAIFFVTLGSLVLLPGFETAALALGLTIFVVFLKPMVTIIALTRQGYEVRTASLTSFNLDQVSEFALIIAIQALILGRIEPAVFDAIVLAAAASMITSTATHQYREQLFEAIHMSRIFKSAHRKTIERSAVAQDLSHHIVIVGYGRLGQTIARTCEGLNQPYVVVDHNPEQFELARGECENYVFGDIITPISNELANVRAAQLIVSTSADRTVAEHLISLDTDTDVFVRAKTTDEATSFYDAGADYVIVPDDLAADALLETLESVITGSKTAEDLRRVELRSIREYH